MGKISYKEQLKYAFTKQHLTFLFKGCIMYYRKNKIIIIN